MGSIDRNRAFWLLLSLVVAGLTLPRLVIDYGMDGDSIRGMMAARDLLETGIYVPSRLPGNPLYEYVLALLALLDRYIVTNLFSLASFGASIAAFHSIVKERDKAYLLTGLFALTPILLLNAAVTMDYLPGLAAMLWSYECVRRERYGYGFLLAGISIGFRLSSSLFLIPLVLYLLLRGVRTERAGLCGLFGLIIGLAFYLPIFDRSGLAAVVLPAEAYKGLSYLLFAGYKLIMVLGPLATAALVAMLAWNAGTVGRSSAAMLRDRDPDFVLELSTVMLFVLLFAVHADESEYLIPAIPFLYLLLGRWFGRRVLVVFGVLVISFGLVTVELMGGESGRRHVTFKPAWGLLVRDYRDRLHLERLRREITRFDLSDRAVIVTGYGPVLGFENPGLVKADFRDMSPKLDEKGITEASTIRRLRSHEVFLVHGLSRRNVEVLKKEGYRVYCFAESAPSHLMHSWGYDPRAAGMTMLEIRGNNAFFRKPRER